MDYFNQLLSIEIHNLEINTARKEIKRGMDHHYKLMRSYFGQDELMYICNRLFFEAYKMLAKEYGLELNYED